MQQVCLPFSGNKGVPQAPIILKNPLPYINTPSLYAAADCFVLASHGEGWGLPLMEAMAMVFYCTSTF